MVPIKVNKWNSLVQQVEENRQNILTLSEQPPQFDAKGEWNSTTVYAQNDMINYNGSSYFSLQDSNANHTPGASDSAAWWQLLAAQGAQGATGATGATGETGKTGPQGIPGTDAYIYTNTVTLTSPAPDTEFTVLAGGFVTSGIGTADPFVFVGVVGSLTYICVGRVTGYSGDNVNAYIVSSTQITGPQGPKGDPGPTGPAGGISAIYMHNCSFRRISSGGLKSSQIRFCFYSADPTPYTDAMLQIQFGSSANQFVPVCGVGLNSDNTLGYIYKMSFISGSETVYYYDGKTATEQQMQVQLQSDIVTTFS